MISDSERNRNALLCQGGSMDPSIAGQDPLQNLLRSASHGLSRNEVLPTVSSFIPGIILFIFEGNDFFTGCPPYCTSVECTNFF